MHHEQTRSESESGIANELICFRTGNFADERRFLLVGKPKPERNLATTPRQERRHQAQLALANRQILPVSTYLGFL